MNIKSTSIENCWTFKPQRHTDGRGYFQENFRLSEVIAGTEMDFRVRQVNQSKSSAGVIRGFHWADYPPGQSKFVTVQSGRILDFIIDLRIGSPTYLRWQHFEMSAENGAAVLIGNGIGHAFLALENDSIVTYLCDAEYNPGAERSLTPLDSDLGIPFKKLAAEAGCDAIILSDKDSGAPNLRDLISAGLLPIFS
jgi:dTDP-4-dehydrorhamnose 3,5-epimerase